MSRLRDFNFIDAYIIAVAVLTIVITANAGKLGLPTVSMTFRDRGWYFSLLPFMGGFLVAHYWFPWFLKSKPWGFGWMWSIPCFVGLLAYDLIWYHMGMPWDHWIRYPGIYFVLGLPAGFFMWSQRI